MVRLERRDDVGPDVIVVTLDRPDRRNALDHATLLQLLDALEACRGARVVVLTGTPPAFCAGADLAGVEEGVFAADLRAVLEGFTDLDAAVVVAVDGPAMGAGAQLVSVCDLRVATPGSTFAIPAARLGLMIDQWTVERMGREFGWPVTRGMLLAAEVYDAERLHGAGVVHRLGDLDDALQWAGRIALLAPLSIAGHKRSLEFVSGGSEPDEALEATRLSVWRSADAAEGRSAFLDKRTPMFRGR
ncbi:MAG: enoyl-CoA hydratase-related protein [Ilumatobacteraceae bacterium]